MILYTPLSQEEIFPQQEDVTAKRQCVVHQGKSMYVEQKEDGSYQLLQLLSTDPQDYLNDSLSPGTILS
ncbi:YlzJ-like family protein [Oceanobacillus manasiensis]|uniref:YlzJ-like family protein n=1 Tax=Oceanobacillus manasiensis TaxID=586413 RepID=UPI0005A7AADE|nr:YlzJ-like family protein [Oceanobacillus manasiensis]